MENMEQVVIPHDYFLNMSKKDYSDYMTALVREFFQNSVDAGAENFSMKIDTTDHTFTVTDDGCGMDESILRNKLLVLGESHKEKANSVGAFGHAKLLLYFSWGKWEIRTQDILVSGQANYFKIEKMDDFFHGTKSTIWMPEQIHNNLRYSIDHYFTYCNTNCKVTVFYNDKEPKYIEQGCNTGNIIFEGEAFNIYEGTNAKGYNMLVRQNGLLMFNQYIGGSWDKIMPILEIKKAPAEMLMQSRDYFKKPYDNIISRVTNQLSSESIESFKILNEGARGVTLHSGDDIFCKISKPHSINFSHIASYEMVNADALKLLTQRRTIRLISICEAYYNYMLNNGFNINDKTITFGITENRDGMCKKVDDGYQIFININSITKHSPNYRKMSVILFNIIKHEFAHVLTSERNSGEMPHDHRFVSCYDEILDTFWDTVPITNIFKKTWKEF